MKSISLKMNIKEIKSVVINGADKAKGTVASFGSSVWDRWI